MAAAAAPAAAVPAITTDSKNMDGQKKGMMYRKGKRTFSFVVPWPSGKNYLSRNGNSLTKELEDHFRGHCHKCGHSSHAADKCKIYIDQATILNLCNRCCQGFHDVCKSKRRDLVAKEPPKSMQMSYPVPVPFYYPSFDPHSHPPYSQPPPRHAIKTAETTDDESE